jgi:peptidoglycan hydrolase CwlO-like protein
MATTASSGISLSTVSAEIQFLADFVSDVQGKANVSDADIARIKALIASAQTDLSAAIKNISGINLGQSLGGGDTPPGQ